jgi:hypothetical protein
VEAIELERVRRARSGQTKREKSQQHLARAPDVLAKIMDNEGANDRHRIDSVKTLDALAGESQTAPLQEERFVINIVLSANEKITIDKPIRRGPDDGRVIEHDDDTPPPLAAIAANKRKDGDGGQSI